MIIYSSYYILSQKFKIPNKLGLFNIEINRNPIQTGFENIKHYWFT